MPRPLVRVSRAAVVLAFVAPVLALLPAATVAADAAGVTPTVADGPHLYASTYLYTGTQQTFTVPEGVSAVQVKAVGAAGGDAGGSPGGRGAEVTGTLAVTTGQTLYLWVGGQGGSSGLSGARGWNGGGRGGQSDTAGGGGGGASDVRTCPAAVQGCDSISSRVLVAAGGGGAGAGGTIPGGDAGQAGSSPSGPRGTAGGGGAGTASAGGAGGVAAPSDSSEYAGYGEAGTLTTGGDSIRIGGYISYAGGGGGGGGVYGGGGGALLRFYGGGGGGGSSLVPAGGAATVSDRGTAASITVSYDLGPVTEMRVRAADGVLVATGADTRVLTATARTEGGARIPGLDVDFSSTDPGQSFGPVTDNADGTYSVTLRSSTTVGTATVTATAAGSTSANDVLGTLDVATEGYTVSVATVAKTLVATAHDTATVTATAESTSGKKLTGLSVSFVSTDAGQSFGTVSAGGGGTYSATLTGSATPGTATVTPVVTGAGAPTLTGTSVATEGYTVSIATVTKTLVATGHDSATVTATAESTSGKKLTGLSVSFASTDAGQSFGTVSAGAGGTYSATLTGSATPGTATVTPVVTGAGAPTLTGTSVATEGYTVVVGSPVRSLVATGWDVLTMTAQVETASGRALPGLDLSFGTTDPEQAVGPVTDHGDGAYSAVLTGSTDVGSATVTAIVTGAGSPVVTNATVVTEGYSITVLPMAEHLTATGTATRVVMARAQTASGQPVPDLDVLFSSTDGGHRFGSVSDRGDGTYSARLTGSTTAGTASISARVIGAGSPATVPADLVSDAYLAPGLTATVSAATPARNGWYRSPVTVTFACTGTMLPTTACPAATVLSGNGARQVVTRSVTDSLGATGSATSAPVSIDLTKPTVKVTGAKNGKAYAKAPRLTCKATDALSGVASCAITTKKSRSAKGTLVRWTAVALDRAGNSASVKGSYTIRKPARRR
ncbi:hypothetical protein ASC77_01915 [Nocardioides sp. Root1257]|uniref:invasin domain 3-containing protein n=1 Tax=unclassified Nocardioides TaxID=2615069 RepID=UPI0006F91CB5|nr:MULTISPECIES: invasin domain 3-containing protein [unclassified Nocardioides]KQW53080.1 hypothetical protein ASC77_01915 [Nocardioides sp. Root1257]KRC55768.1 hypothetical protein ASE24_01915 [Nocardioides sp. Root224]